MNRYRKHNRKKQCIILLAVMLYFCILFTAYMNIPSTISVFASANSSQSDENTMSEKAEAVYTNSAGQMVEDTFPEAVKNTPEGGTIKLLTDIYINSGITISKSVFITSNNPDSPCMIKNNTSDTNDGKETGRIFTVEGAQLQLSNIILDGGRSESVIAYHPLIYVNNGAVMLKNNAVLQNAENACPTLGGGAVNIRLGQVIIYDNAVITHCKAIKGGAIEINSKGTYTQAMLGMAGGSIINCEAENGGGISVKIGMFQMQGGEIIQNRATNKDSETVSLRQGGGAIYVTGESNQSGMAAVLIQNGRIAGNEAYNGGGILLQGPYALLQLNGGTVEENEAHNGGGISVIRGNLKLYGGTVTGNTAVLYGGGILSCPNGLVELQGNPKVFENTSGDVSDRYDNLYLDGNEDENLDITLPIALTGPLTDGVRLGISRWVRPDDDEHPERDVIMSSKDMIQSSGKYTITQEDINRLTQTRTEENKQLYADNMEQFALIPYNGKIVMVLPTDVVLDKNELRLAKAGSTGTLTASVTPVNALIKDVTWQSSDETVATVDEHGVVTAVGKGNALITATTVSPYHATAVCNVKVAAFHQITTSAEHGTITYEPDGPFQENDQIMLTAVPDQHYQFKAGSFKAGKTGEDNTTIALDDNTLVMPDFDVTVTAVFEPIVYPVTYELDGGSLQGENSNPPEYTIESPSITLKNPTKDGYIFVGWVGTDLTEATTSATIPTGSTGMRSYTAIWKKIIPMETTAPIPAETTTPAPTETTTVPTETSKVEEPTQPDIPNTTIADKSMENEIDSSNETPVAEPNTGDKSNTTLWLTIMLTALAGIIGMIGYKKKQINNR